VDERFGGRCVRLHPDAVQLRRGTRSLLDDLETRARLAVRPHRDGRELRALEVAFDLGSRLTADDHHGADGHPERGEYARDVHALAAGLPVACLREMARADAQLRDEAGPIDCRIRRDGHHALHAPPGVRAEGRRWARAGNERGLSRPHVSRPIRSRADPPTARGTMRSMSAAIRLVLAALALASCAGPSWEQVRAQDTPAGYLRFLDEHPGSKYTAEAQERLAILQFEKAPTLAALDRFRREHATARRCPT
jgi:hypothetical protein